MADETTPETAPEAVAAAPETSESGGATKSGAAQTLREHAGQFTQQAADRARSLADEGKARATDALDEFSKLMHDAAGTVDEKLGEEYGRYARSAAEGISSFSESLKGKEVEDLIADARDLVRKSPAVAIGTAAAIGFVLARLIKSGIDATADAADPDTSAKGSTKA